MWYFHLKPCSGVVKGCRIMALLLLHNTSKQQKQKHQKKKEKLQMIQLKRRKSFFTNIHKSNYLELKPPQPPQLPQPHESTSNLTFHIFNAAVLWKSKKFSPPALFAWDVDVKQKTFSIFKENFTFVRRNFIFCHFTDIHNVWNQTARHFNTHSRQKNEQKCLSELKLIVEILAESFGWLYPTCHKRVKSCKVASFNISQIVSQLIP